jgi:hypothetical protein
VEAKIEEFWANVRLEADWADNLRQGLEAELAGTRRQREREAKRQGKRLERLIAERDKLMRALYADAVPMDLFKAEQGWIA